MKILVIADSEINELWTARPDGSGRLDERLEGLDLILSAGDLAPSYLEYLVTVTNLPLLYIRGNHDSIYDTMPPEGCICIEDNLAEVYYDLDTGKPLAIRMGRTRRASDLERDMLAQLMPAWGGELPGQTYGRSYSSTGAAARGGLVWGRISRRDRLVGRTGILRIAGLGGSMRYRNGRDMYTEAEMTGRVKQLDRRLQLLAAHGRLMNAARDTEANRTLDILLTHAPCRGYGDMEDLPHRGFECFNRLLDKWQPQYHFYGHVHREYGGSFERELSHPSGTLLINACSCFKMEL